MGEKSFRPSREIDKQLIKNKMYEGQVFNVYREEYMKGYVVNPFHYMLIDRELRKEWE